jgi:hypothetical protein
VLALLYYLRARKTYLLWLTWKKAYFWYALTYGCPPAPPGCGLLTLGDFRADDVIGAAAPVAEDQALD